MTSDVQMAAPVAAHKSNAKWFAIAALVIAGGALMFITVGGIGENLVYYWSPTDIQNAGPKAVGATIRLGGQVAPGSVVYQPGTSSLAFDVTDGGAKVHVKSDGVPPQMFREGIGVVVEGTMTDGGYFTSNRLMVSHSNEYRAPEEGGHVDTKQMMKSTDGIEVKE